MNKAIPATARALIAAALRKPVAINPDRVDNTSHLRRFTKQMPIGAALALVHADEKVDAVDEREFEHSLQRNTKGRASDARKTGYLRFDKEVLATQHHLQLVLWKGKLEGLDGNTRMMLWADKSQLCKVPAIVDVTFYVPESEAEYDNLYLSIDSGFSHKNSKDLLYGIFKALGLEPTSALFSQYKVTSAIKHIAGLEQGCSVQKLKAATESLMKELQILDSYGFDSRPSKTFSSGVWVAMLLLARDQENPEALRNFFNGLKFARETGGANDIFPKAVNDFITAYNQIESPGVAKKIPAVAKLTREAFAQFMVTFVPQVKTANDKRLTASPKANKKTVKKTA